MITIEQLTAKIGTPDMPLIVDVRTDEDFAEWPYLLPNSLRCPHTDVAGLKGPIATLCHKGLKLSQGAAALLRYEGQSADLVEGGAVAWRAAGGLHIDPADLPASQRWTVPSGPEAKLAIWIAKRFHPNQTRVLEVDEEAAPLVADRFSAPLTTPAQLAELVRPCPPGLRHMIEISQDYHARLTHATLDQALAICDAAFAQYQEAAT